MCFISHKLLSILFLTALSSTHTPHNTTTTHTPTPTLLETEDIAMMGTKARRWKLRPDGPSNQGLITAQYIILRARVCVSFWSHLSAVHAHTHVRGHAEKHTLHHKTVTDGCVILEPLKHGGMVWLLSHSFTEASQSIAELMCLTSQRRPERQSGDLSQIAWTHISPFDASSPLTFYLICLWPVARLCLPLCKVSQESIVVHQLNAAEGTCSNFKKSIQRECEGSLLALC